MKIDSAGGICGHHTITVYSKAILYSYGRLQLDSLRVTGGTVILFSPGESIFTKSVILTVGGANMLVKAKMSVGPWFQCAGGEYKSSISTQYIKNHCGIYPNPNNGTFKFYHSLLNISNTFKLTDMNGKSILEKSLTGNLAEFDISMLPDGIYYWQLISDNQLIDSGKISLIH